MTGETKRCTRCGKGYPATREWFKKDKRTKSGLASICKSCAAAYTRQWHEQHVADYSDDKPAYGGEPPSAYTDAQAPSEDVEKTHQQGVETMAGYQQVTIVGNVGRDPKMTFTQSGIAVCDFSVAVTRKFGGRDGGEKREKTTWFRVTCWRQQAEIANQYVRKGTPILVVGTVEVNAYLDKSGQPAASLELTADTFQMLGSRGDAQQGASAGGQGGYEDNPPPDDLNEIPF